MIGIVFMTVSLCMIAYNEEEVLPGLLEEVYAQTFDKKKTELVFVDSASTDKTRAIFNQFKEKHIDEYMNIVIADNPRKIQSAGWNTAIKTAMGDIIIRLDAHASIPKNFIEKNEELIADGEYVCGGARPNNIDKPTAYREMLLAAESSMFGSSFAGYRRQAKGKKYVSSLFHGAYRREVFARVGGFNVSLGRTEDNELHYRIRQNGYKICQSDEIISYQNIRPTLRGMLAQKFGNGKWIGLTVGVCPECLSIFHFAPFCLVAVIILFLILMICGMISGQTLLLLPMILLAAAYCLGDLLITTAAIITAEHKSLYMLLLPVIFPMLHIVYGIGTLTGFIMLPFWKSSLDGSAEKEIEEVRESVKNGVHKAGFQDK